MFGSMKKKPCPNCNIPLKPAAYGMMAPGPDNDKYFQMGCLMDENQAVAGCNQCGYLVYQDGSVDNPFRFRQIYMMLGLAVGDALGAPYEFHPPVSQETPIVMEHNGWPAGRWTDDTDMAIGILQAWSEVGNITSIEALDRLVEIWNDWAKTAPDVGIQTRTVLSRMHEVNAINAFAESEALHEETGRTAGNGSLMRIAPLALMAEPDEVIAETVVTVTKLTHWDDDNSIACLIWVFAIRAALRTGQPDFFAGFKFLSEKDQERWYGYIQEANIKEPHEFPNNGWVVAAFQAAASAVLHNPFDFKSGIEAAVRAGYDTDTVAAIAGSLLGPIAGWSIPQEWIDNLNGWPGLDAKGLEELTLKVL